jgi:hypothetical protein
MPWRHEPARESGPRHIETGGDDDEPYGPDLEVYLLGSSETSSRADLDKVGFVTLGALKGNIGPQNYTIPEDVELAKYHAVAIWCHRFGVNFTTAVLEPDTTVVGSDAGAVERAITRAARSQKAAVDVAAMAGDPTTSLRIQISVNMPPTVTQREAADVMVAVTEDRLVSHVAAGENRGRRLTHSAVVRVLTRVGTLSPDKGRWSTAISASVQGLDARLDHGPEGRHVGFFALRRLVTVLQSAARRAAEPSWRIERAGARSRRHHV